MTPTSNHGKALQDIRVLVAEDAFHISLVIETVLEAEGAVIVGTAATLEAGCEIAQRERPALAVVDLKLGEDDSLPLIRILQDFGAKIVVATGYDLTRDLERALAGLPLLKKPYTPEQLLEQIRKLL